MFTRTRSDLNDDDVFVTGDIVLRRLGCHVNRNLSGFPYVSVYEPLTRGDKNRFIWGIDFSSDDVLYGKAQTRKKHEIKNSMFFGEVSGKTEERQDIHTIPLPF